MSESGSDSSGRTQKLLESFENAPESTKKVDPAPDTTHILKVLSEAKLDPTVRLVIFDDRDITHLVRMMAGVMIVVALMVLACAIFLLTWAH